MGEDSTVEIRDERGSLRCFVDNAIIDVYGPILGPYGLAMYLALCRHANKETQQCFPHVKTLIAETGMKYVKGHAVLKQLCELGLIKKESGKEAGTGNSYILLKIHDDPEQQKEYARALGYLEVEEEGVHVANRVFTTRTPGIHQMNRGIHRANTPIHHMNRGIHRTNRGVHRMNTHPNNRIQQPNSTTEKRGREARFRAPPRPTQPT